MFFNRVVLPQLECWYYSYLIIAYMYNAARGEVRRAHRPGPAPRRP
jgi:hypothetical protein